MVEPVAQPGWMTQLVIPTVEDDDTPVALFKAALYPYDGIGAIYVPPVLTKYILIIDTGLDIVCGPRGELCACYHNGNLMDHSRTEVSDLDFLSCWLSEPESGVELTAVTSGTCHAGRLPRVVRSLSGARS